MRYKSPSRAKIDDQDFPLRVCQWLDGSAGRGQWAWHSSRLGGDGIYLRRPEVAVALLAAFPQLDLADMIDHRPPPGPPLAPH